MADSGPPPVLYSSPVLGCLRAGPSGPRGLASPALPSLGATCWEHQGIREHPTKAISALTMLTVKGARVPSGPQITRSLTFWGEPSERARKEGFAGT